MLCFLNQLDFKKRDGDLIEEMTCVKRQFVIEIGDYKIVTMIYVLDIFDEIIVLNVTDEINDFLEQSST